MATNDKTNTPTNGIVNDTSDIAFTKTQGFTPEEEVPVGGVILAQGDINYNINRRTKKLTVRNTGDRPIQIGSHFHFFECNRYMEFDRKAAFGMHLNIPATTAIRFEPGEEKEVEVVEFAGKRRIIGFNGLTMGYSGLEDTPSYYPTKTHAYRMMKLYGFKDIPEEDAEAEFTTTPKK